MARVRPTSSPAAPAALAHAPVLLLLALWLIAPLAADARTGSREVGRGPRPGWVVPVEPAPPSRADDVSGGVDYLLMDDQVRVTGDAAEHWARRVRKVTSATGVETESQFQLDWDPSHESLVLHRLVVWRDGKELDRLAGASIEVVRREPNFEAALLDGTLSALVVIHDVRPGDVVDHEFTTTGGDPVFAGHWFGGFTVNWDGPVRRLGFRVTWPSARQVHWRSFGIESDPVLRRIGEDTEATWLFSDVPPALAESDQPAWYDPSGWVQLSEFAAWADLVRWALPLYELPATGAAFDELAGRLRAEGADDESRALAAVRFVQDDVRYLGLEIGSGSQEPSPPGVVLDRRFGDCKDKTVLLVALLRALGLEAAPALVSTTDGAELAGRLPSPGDFDHVIVRLRLGGRTCWIDPTIAGQRGRLFARHVPRYAKALVLAPGTTGLEDVVPSPDDAPKTEVSVRFVLPSVGGPATMTVRTSYHGRDADATRADLAGESREDTQRGYEDYYARLYPSLEAARPLVVRDDEDANVLITEESYRIGAMWTLSDDGSTWTADFHAPEIEDRLVPPDQPLRESPMAIDHPQHVEHRAVIELPAEWSVAPESRTLAGPAATFSHSVEREGRRIELTYEWRTTLDWIPASQAPEHAAMIADAYEATSFRLSAAASGQPLAEAGATDAGRGLNWSVLALALMTGLAGAAGGLVLCLWVPVRVESARQAAAASPPAGEVPAGATSSDPDAAGTPGSDVVAAPAPAPAPAGQGALVVISLALPVALLVSLMRSLPPYELARWNALTVPGPAHEPLAAPLLLLSLVASVLLLMLSGTLLPLLLMRRSAFRVTAAGVMLGGLCAEAFRVTAARLVPAAFPAAISGSTLALAALVVVPAAAWVVASPRVRALLAS